LATFRFKVPLGDIVAPGDVAVSPKLSRIAIVHTAPGLDGTVNVADHSPEPAEKAPGVDEPEQLPPHVAVVMLLGAVPAYVP
jgi:hypothetical protein